ncbi:hypothetical protein [Streptomyces sp. ISL-100]|uniref:hypothetical protein n=1 Tax=Streptomyces sp. ISL-100 TaxID=2819173 RepID=UPI001BED0E9A|nr:hypothetical protein [Streptomyces sp. ISL-100]MBT2400635.1 hypothetical protein [Streptomyces sp. ISL-100]
MPATITSHPAQAQGSTDGRDPKKKAAIMPQPFTRAAKEHQEPMLDTTQQLGASSVAMGPFDVPAYGYMRGIWLWVSATGGSGTATVAMKEDAPFSAISEIALIDVNGANVIGPLNGYDLYLSNKWFGYNLGDPKQNTMYVPPVTGANASGNFGYLLYLPVELSGRDGLGSLPNANAASTYKVRVTLAPDTEVYTTAPTVRPQVRVRAWLDAWTQPNATDLRGNANSTQPPAMGTTQYLSKTTQTISAGFQQPRMTRVGSYIRNLLFVFRDAAGSRAAGQTNFPSDVSMFWDSKNLFTRHKDLWQAQMARRSRYNAAIETAGGRDNGVWLEDFTHEFDGQLGNELRDGWLGTVQSTRLELSGQFGTAGTLTILTNDVAPAGPIFME